MLRIQGAIAIIIVIFGIIALNPAFGRMYRWVDENGQVHYSDRVPPEYSNKERKVYNEEGRLISTLRAERIKEQSAAEKNKADGEAQQHKPVEQQDKVAGTTLKSQASAQELKKTTEVPLAAIEK